MSAAIEQLVFDLNALHGSQAAIAHRRILAIKDLKLDISTFSLAIGEQWETCCFCRHADRTTSDKTYMLVHTHNQRWGQWRDRYLCKPCALELAEHLPAIVRAQHDLRPAIASLTTDERSVLNVFSSEHVTVSEVAKRLRSQSVEMPLYSVSDICEALTQKQLLRKHQSKVGGLRFFSVNPQLHEVAA